ncbi:MAG: translesion error-prone DNA polymerase V autoproteolytic subunit [Pedobacter sp.]|nr:MAG: translesion error-prone DNA polymerase V autoproteolytic subunit [Pedobacter sp.]
MKATVGQGREVPFYEFSVPAGFPSPAMDYVEKKLSADELLGLSKPSVFFCRVAGDSMIGAGIYDGDLLVVDFALEPKNDNIVVAIICNELTVKRLCITPSEWMLMAENPIYPPLIFSRSEELRVWGVVTHNLHKLLG